MTPPEDEFTEMHRIIIAGIIADQAERAREKPDTPKRVLRKVNLPGASSGTRSPSTMPDKAPTPQLPTSLRTVATTNSIAEAMATVPDAGEGSGTSDSNSVAAMQSHLSHVIASPPCAKRPLVDKEDAQDLAKRMRFMPESQELTSTITPPPEDHF
jgi:hypothetical protein